MSKLLKPSDLEPQLLEVIRLVKDEQHLDADDIYKPLKLAGEEIQVRLIGTNECGGDSEELWTREGGELHSRCRVVEVD